MAGREEPRRGHNACRSRYCCCGGCASCVSCAFRLMLTSCGRFLEKRSCVFSSQLPSAPAAVAAAGVPRAARCSGWQWRAVLALGTCAVLVLFSVLAAPNWTQQTAYDRKPHRVRPAEAAATARLSNNGGQEGAVPDMVVRQSFTISSDNGSSSGSGGGGFNDSGEGRVGGEGVLGNARVDKGDSSRVAAGISISNEQKEEGREEVVARRGVSVTSSRTTNTLPSCEEPLYGVPVRPEGSSEHPYLRPVPDPEMALYRRRVEGYLASPAFRARIRQLQALDRCTARRTDASTSTGGGSDGGRDGGGGAVEAGCAPEGILISAGGPRLLTNLVVLLRVLRHHLNCTLPVEVAWAGPEELGGGSGNTGSRDSSNSSTLSGSSGNSSDAASKDDDGDAGAEEEEKEQQPFISKLRAAGLGPVYGLDLSRMPYPEHHRRPPKITHWGAKVFALLASSRFRRVLLLDADILPLADPRVTLLPLLLQRPLELQQQGGDEHANPMQPIGEHEQSQGLSSNGSSRSSSSSGAAAVGRHVRGVVVWPDAWRGWAGEGAYRELGLDPRAARAALNLLPSPATAEAAAAAVGGYPGSDGGSGGSRKDDATAGGDDGATPGRSGFRWPRRDAESGAVLIDRAAHADVLEYLWWINSFGDRLYHRLLHGDKDTFAAAFAVAGKAHCYWQVATPPGGAFQWGRNALEVKAPLPAPAPPPAAAAAASSPPAPAPPPPAFAPPPSPTHGWQLVGFTQHHPTTGQPLLLHRTMNKWAPLKLSRTVAATPAAAAATAAATPPTAAATPEAATTAAAAGGGPPLQLASAAVAAAAVAGGMEGRRAAVAAAERGWPLQVLTGPLPTRWCEYYLAHDSRGPTKGVWWEHVVPKSALRLVPHPACVAAVTAALPNSDPVLTASTLAASASPPTAAAAPPYGSVLRRWLQPPGCSPWSYSQLLGGAFTGGLPTARSTAAAALHAACAPALREAMSRAAERAGIGSGIKNRTGAVAVHRTGLPYNTTTMTVAAAAAAAAALGPPWRLGDRRLAAALVRALLTSAPGSPTLSPPPFPSLLSAAAAPLGFGAGPPPSRSRLPSWPSLHAALFRQGMTEDLLEEPYTPGLPYPPPSLQRGNSGAGTSTGAVTGGGGDEWGGRWPPPPPPLLGLAVCVATPVGAEVSTHSAESRCGPVVNKQEKSAVIAVQVGDKSAGTAQGTAQGGVEQELLGHGEPLGWRRLIWLPAGSAHLQRPSRRPPGTRVVKVPSAFAARTAGGGVAGVESAAGGTAVAVDDAALAVMAAAYQEHEWALEAAASGQWPELVQWE